MALESGIKSLKTVVAIYEADIDTANKSVSLQLQLQPYDPVVLDLRSALISALSKGVSSKVRAYIDKERFLKTLLNFGDDTQRILTNWRLDPNNSNKLLVKLLTPLDFNLDIGNTVFLSREVANTVVDTIKLEAPQQPDTISTFLRPPNIPTSVLRNIPGIEVLSDTDLERLRAAQLGIFDLPPSIAVKLGITNPDAISRLADTILGTGNIDPTIAEQLGIDPATLGRLSIRPFSNPARDILIGSRPLSEIIRTSKPTLSLNPTSRTDLENYSTAIVEEFNVPVKTLSNTTLTDVGITLEGTEDEYGGYSFRNELLRQWYTDDYRSVELNVDYTNYANFITYSSAKLRLDAFKQKITKIRELETKSRFYNPSTTDSIFGFSATVIDVPTIYSTDTTLASPVLIDESGSALVTTGSTLTIYAVDALPSAAAYLVEGAKEAALEIENIIRSFDGYERYLFYQSGSAYSASAYWQLNDTEYNTDGTWPKKDQDGNLYSPTSIQVQNWYEIQSAIAQRYDDNNVHLLSNAVPQYLQDDINSQDFIKFTQMIGHLFDNIKLYIDQMPNIYDRKINATEGLSQDLVWNVAKSFGISISNPDAAASLYNFTTDGNVPKRREQITELYKRFLHNAPYLNKTRGTVNALKTLLNIFGLNEQVIGIRETDTPSTGSYEIFDEVTNALNFNTGSYLVLPMSGALQRETYTLQFRFNNSKQENTTLGVGDTGAPSGSWTVELATHPSSSSPMGRVVVKDTIGEILLSSSYTDIFSDEDYYDVMLRYTVNTVDLLVAHSDGEEITYSSSMSTTGSYLCDAWKLTQNFYLGGSGSLSLNNFNGLVDEVRVWGEQITDEVFYNQVLDPGSFVGNDYISPVQRLWIRSSFHKPKNLWSGSITNESPYFNKEGFPFSPPPAGSPVGPLPNLTNIIAVGFENKTTYPYSMARVSRRVRQYTTNAGAYSYGSKNIIIAPPPVFTEVQTDGGQMLYRTKSIVNNETRRQQQQTKNYLGFFVSPTDAVNNLLIRALGNVDVRGLVGINPRYESRYRNIEVLQNYYTQHYNATVNIPQFVRFFDELSPTLFEQASQLIPARTVLGTGIVIEPNILERKKVTFEKPLKLSGENTRKNRTFTSTEKTYTRDFDITLSTGTTINIKARESQSAEYTDYNTKINITEASTLSGEANNVFATELTSSLVATSGENYTYNTNTLYITSSMPEADILSGLLEGATIESVGGTLLGEYPYYEGPALEAYYSRSVESVYEVFDSDIDKLSYINYLQTYGGMTPSEARQAAVSYKPGNIIDIGDIIGKDDRLSYASVINVIAPRADFDDYGVINYFIRDSGIYTFETVYKEIIGQNSLNFLSGPSATWSFGTRYNRDDVVVQYGATGSAKISNGKLFRYIAQDAPSVSYNFPSVDANRWAPVFYRGRAVNTPYRIIFDINKAAGNQAVDTLPVTKVLISRPIVAPGRYSKNLTLNAVSANSTQQGLIRLQSIASLFSVNVEVSNIPSPSIRIRLYDRLDKRNADVNRLIGVEPTGDHGVLLDMTFESGSVSRNVGLYPPVSLINNDPGLSSSPVIYYTINELAGNNYNNGFVVRFNYFAIEAPIELPIGYLPRHYKFFRDTLLATKRRNYVGCLQTQDTTTDGRSPVEVTFTAGTTITVSPNILQEEDNLGGINLNVN